VNCVSEGESSHGNVERQFSGGAAGSELSDAEAVDLQEKDQSREDSRRALPDRVNRDRAGSWDETDEAKTKDEVLGTMTARNKLRGKVVVVKIDGLLAQVIVDIGGQFVSAIVTADSCREQVLKPGVMVHAVFKATDVMMSRT